MWWENLVAIIGALGGIETVKWFMNRKTNSRIAIADAESKEFHTLQETNEWLQKQLQLKEERFAEQTQLVRKQNTEILDLTRKIAEAEIAHAQAVAELRIELAEVRCNDENCPFRQPPNAKTPPHPGLTKEQYYASKADNQK